MILKASLLGTRIQLIFGQICSCRTESDEPCAADTESGYGLYAWGVGVQVLVRVRARFTASPHCPGLLWGPPSLLSNVYWCSFSEAKAAGAWNCPLTSSYYWIPGSVHPLPHMPSWHSAYRDNLTIYLYRAKSGERMFCHTVAGVEKVVTVTRHECKPEEFECQPGNCIPGKWKCDGQKVKHISVYWFWCFQ
jgi:hypothetical protein